MRPRDAAGKARRRVAAELIADLERIYTRKKTADKELRELIEATGTSLLTLNGIGPSGAARLLINVGDITRFPTKGHFASWNGTAPLDASSGDRVRHRLSRAGNRQINRTLHIMATIQLRNATEGRAYYDRKKASGKTSMEAMRCLKRRLAVRHRLSAHGQRRRPRDDGPGRTGERPRSPARPAHIPTPALRTSHFPDPPPLSLGPTSQPRLDTEGSHDRWPLPRQWPSGVPSGRLEGLYTVACLTDFDRLRDWRRTCLRGASATAAAVGGRRTAAVGFGRSLSYGSAPVSITA